MARSVMEEVARRWRLPLESEGKKLWGEYTAMLGSFFKGEERVKVIIKTPTIQELYVESMAVGEVRGKAIYTDPSRAGSPERAGSMNISKVLYGAAKPYNTSIESSGVPEVDWKRFFNVSEQVPTIVRIDSIATNDDTRSCGFIVQKMTPTISDELQQHLRNIGTTTLKLIAADVGNAGVELTCDICNDTHHLAAVELEDLINSLSDSQ
ncbi:hypothetical protein PsorP6_004694 [Peronosclerospora sorghi]|uniref:Uncharacterized protein n=1 Tax=Peronosclerospora sorghi TaxID=230839 RepID=A0ACC0VLM1_9STRA|nr:hypothetical protein PsorP6_004694 [Peronosclerospora sorghi]